MEKVKLFYEKLQLKSKTSPIFYAMRFVIDHK